MVGKIMKYIHPVKISLNF